MPGMGLHSKPEYVKKLAERQEEEKKDRGSEGLRRVLERAKMSGAVDKKTEEASELQILALKALEGKKKDEAEARRISEEIKGKMES